MTAEDKYLFLIRNIRRRINDSAPEGGPAPCFSNEDLRDEIDLASNYAEGGQGDLLNLQMRESEIVILRVWLMIAKMLAFDSCKFFSITQTDQTINKGERVAHYLSLADDLERVLKDAKESLQEQIVVGNINVIDRDTVLEKSREADMPPVSVALRSIENMSGLPKGDTGTLYAAGDWRFKWERSTEWDFNDYRVYYGTTPNVDKDIGRPLFNIVDISETEYTVSLAHLEPGTYYAVIYVQDNREQFSEASDAIQFEISTGSV